MADQNEPIPELAVVTYTIHHHDEGLEGYYSKTQEELDAAKRKLSENGEMYDLVNSKGLFRYKSAQVALKLHHGGHCESIKIQNGSGSKVHEVAVDLGLRNEGEEQKRSGLMTLLKRKS